MSIRTLMEPHLGRFLPKSFFDDFEIKLPISYLSDKYFPLLISETSDKFIIRVPKLLLPKEGDKIYFDEANNLVINMTLDNLEKDEKLVSYISLTQVINLNKYDVANNKPEVKEEDGFVKLIFTKRQNKQVIY